MISLTLFKRCVIVPHMDTLYLFKPVHTAKGRLQHFLPKGLFSQNVVLFIEFHALLNFLCTDLSTELS